MAGIDDRSTDNSSHGLIKTVRYGDLIFLVIGTVIGSGIFLVPSIVLRHVQGRLDLALLVWVTGGALSLMGALTYAELTSMHPRVGGLYVFLRDCFGGLVAFLYGWTMFFMIGAASVATLAVAFSTYLNHLIPMPAWGARAAAIVMIVVIAVINVVGTRKSADVQNLTTVIKASAILILSVLLIWFAPHHAEAEAPVTGPISGSLVAGFGLAMISVLWAYEGWAYCTFSAGETVNPQRDFPRAFLIGTLALIFIYLSANVAYVVALGPTAAAHSNGVAADAITAVLGYRWARLCDVVILISIFSAANSVVLTAPRVYFAMANDKLFFRSLAKVHPKFRTPAFAIIAGCAWAIVLAASGTYEQLLTYVVFTGWIFYGLGAAAVFVYRRRQPAQPRPYHVPGYPWTPLVFVIAATFLVANTIYAQPYRAGLGLLLMLAGIPAYLLWRSRSAEKPSPLAAAAPDQST